MSSAGISFETFRLEPAQFEQLSGFEQEEHLEAWRIFRRSCVHIVAAAADLRAVRPTSPELIELCRQVVTKPEIASAQEARSAWIASFDPYRIVPNSDSPDGFLTGYYEPIVEGSRVQTAEFTEPILGRPDDLVSSIATEGALEPYQDRAAIDGGAIADRCRPVVWLRDAIEVFMMQVQGSGRITLPDGSMLRLVYAGRNGRPYTSIGRILIESGEIAPDVMSIDVLKDWVRRNGQNAGQPGRELLHRNRSYVFFEIAEGIGPAEGPIGGQGLPLTPLRSLAVDRSLWSYGLPFWIDAAIPSRAPFHQMMIAQDTGSAIVGPARFDIFFGSGEPAGLAASLVRHACAAWVLLPKPGART